MTVKVIFDECSVPFWIDIAYRLTKQYDWKPCYWTGDPGFGQQVKQQFPDIIFHSTLDAIRGLPAKECKDLSLLVLDQPLLEDLAFCELISLYMMNRIDRINAFSFEEREQLFKQYVRYWSAILKKFIPDVVVFSASPHLVYDYVLYSLCKRNKIQTILFDQTSLDGWIYPEARFEDGSELLKKRYHDMVSSWKLGKNKKIMLTDEAESYLKRVSGDYSGAVPFYMKEQFAQNNITKYIAKKVLSNPKNLSNIFQKGWHLFSRGHYIKQKRKSIQDSNMKGFEYLWCKAQGMRKKNMLKHHYQTLQQPAEFHKPYIYFPLHYQPENTSSPLGETFADQFLIVDMLSKCAPANWIIYVKEHSSQWHLKLHGECSRNTDFYDRLVHLPNVKLIPISTPNFELIDHAKAVVTITGTSGWEAVIRGKPALVFGHAWYKFCEGVFYIPTENTCRDTLSKINAGYTVDRELVRLFLSAVQEIGLNAYVEPSYAKIVDISNEENVSRITTAIYTFYLQSTTKK